MRMVEYSEDPLSDEELDGIDEAIATERGGEPGTIRHANAQAKVARMAKRMARELRRLYECERVLRVEAEQLRAELVRTRAETTIDEGEAG